MLEGHNLQTDVTSRARNQTSNQKWIPFLLYPDDIIKKYWAYLQICLLLYGATIEPFIVSFYEVHERHEIFETIHIYIDLLFMLDILLSFLMPFERRDGSFEGNIKKIA